MRLRIIHIKVFFRERTDYVTTTTDIFFYKYQQKHQVNSNKEHQEIGSLKKRLSVDIIKANLHQTVKGFIHSNRS